MKLNFSRHYCGVIIIALFLTSIISSAFSMGPSKIDQLEDAILEAKETNQKIVAVFGAKWCVFCVKLDKDLENNPKILDNYIYVYIDIDKQNYLKETYDVRIIPDIMVIENGFQIKRKTGYNNLEELQKWLNKE